MVGRLAWRLGRSLSMGGMRTRTISSAAEASGATNMVEKLAERMLVQREALLQNVRGAP